MVAFLKKPEGSIGFHQIVDFLNSTHIKYALTENPTIYVSLIHQFWQTASASTSENGEMEITATIDGRVKTVTEASIRRHLKLEDSNGISTLPNTEFFEQLALMGYVSNSDRLTFQKGHFPHQWRFLIHTIPHCEGSTIPVESHYTPTDAPSTSQPHISSTLRSPIRQETKVPQLSSPPHTNVANEAASTGVDVRYRGAAITVTSLDAGQGSGNINKTPSMPHDSPLPRGHTLESDEGRMQHNKLMNLVTKLLDRCKALETDLRQTKKVYGDAFTKLIKKVKTLEKTTKTSQARRRARVVISDDEEELEDPSKQGWKIAQIDQDPTISLVRDNADIQGRYGQDMEYDFDLDAAKDVSTTAGVTTVDTTPISTTSISTADVDVADELTLAETLMAIKSSASKTQKLKGVVFKEPSESTTPRPQPKINAKDKGKDIMQEPEKSSKNPVKAQIQLDKELALRLHAKEQAEFLVETIAARKKFFAAQRATKIRKRPPTRTQLRSKMITYLKHMEGGKKRQRADPDEESSKRQKIDWDVYSKDTRRYWRIIRVGNHTEAYQIFPDMLMKFDREDLVKLWDLVKKRFSTTEPTYHKEKELWVELKRLFEPDTGDELWKLQEYIHDPLTWRLYDTCGVHHVSSNKGIYIFMLVEKEYPLTRGLLTVMLSVAGTGSPITPKTDEQKLVRMNELKAKSTLLLAIPNEHLLKFHGFKDAKTLWEAIKASYSSQEVVNLKLLRSLPSAWNNIALIMRNKSDLDTLSMDDLYNNLKLDNEDLEQIDTDDLEEMDPSLCRDDRCLP
ncbi:hypothetical protein Tco_1244283 [Tanacetum coccineum]